MTRTPEIPIPLAPIAEEDCAGLAVSGRISAAHLLASVAPGDCYDPKHRRILEHALDDDVLRAEDEADPLERFDARLVALAVAASVEVSYVRELAASANHGRRFSAPRAVAVAAGRRRAMQVGVDIHNSAGDPAKLVELTVSMLTLVDELDELTGGDAACSTVRRLPDVATDEPPPYDEPGTERSEVLASSWEAVDLGPILRGEVITAEPSVLAREDGVRLLYAGKLNLFMGEPESCKTWAADYAVAEELKGGRHVTYVDFEDTPESTVERLRALGVSPAQIEENFTYHHPFEGFDDLAEAYFTGAVTERGPLSLVVVDGVTEAMSQVDLNPDLGIDVARFYSSFPRWFARQGAAVVLIDHVTKSTDARGRWAVGSERKLSGLDGAAYTFTTIHYFARGRVGNVKITVAKDRAGHVRRHEDPAKVIATMELTSWPDGGVTVALGAPDDKSSNGDRTFRPTFVMEKISKAVEDHPRLSKNALRAEAGSKHETADLALELLITEGYVDVETGPNRALQHVSRRPFRVTPEVDDDPLF